MFIPACLPSDPQKIKSQESFATKALNFVLLSNFQHLINLKRMSQSKTNSSIDLLYSKGVSVSDVRKYGCFTTMPVRRHDNHRLHDEVEHRLFDQWNDIIGDGVTDICFGSMNHVSGGWDSLALPEAKPERIYYTIWLTIFFFLLDGM